MNARTFSVVFLQKLALEMLQIAISKDNQTLLVKHNRSKSKQMNSFSFEISYLSSLLTSHSKRQRLTVIDLNKLAVFKVKSCVSTTKVW